MEEEKILENITKSITEKLKAPIITTYICVLFLYNWDIIFYLLFEINCASLKIKYIKETYGSVYYIRILTCLGISIFLIILFTTLNTAIHSCLKWFYKKDKEITSEIENYEKISVLTSQVSTSIDEIKRLNTEISNLKKINDSLTSKNLNLNVSDISEKDYKNLLHYLNTQPNKEKLLFSLKELIENLKNDPKKSINHIYQTATYEHDIKTLINVLISRKLLKETRYTDENHNAYIGLGLSTSFKDFLSMTI